MDLLFKTITSLHWILLIIITFCSVLFLVTFNIGFNKIKYQNSLQKKIIYISVLNIVLILEVLLFILLRYISYKSGVSFLFITVDKLLNKSLTFLPIPYICLWIGTPLIISYAFFTSLGFTDYVKEQRIFKKWRLEQVEKELQPDSKNKEEDSKMFGIQKNNKTKKNTVKVEGSKKKRRGLFSHKKALDSLDEVLNDFVEDIDVKSPMSLRKFFNKTVKMDNPVCVQVDDAFWFPCASDEHVAYISEIVKSALESELDPSDLPTMIILKDNNWEEKKLRELVRDIREESRG